MRAYEVVVELATVEVVDVDLAPSTTTCVATNGAAAPTAVHVFAFTCTRSPLFSAATVFLPCLTTFACDASTVSCVPASFLPFALPLVTASPKVPSAAGSAASVPTRFTCLRGVQAGFFAALLL